MRYERQRSAAEIESEIARVRREMDATLSAIENRLTTDHLVDRGIAYLRQSGAREFASNLGNSVKQNPLSVTLVGVGLAWLMLSGRQDMPESNAEGASAAEGLKDQAGEAMGRIADTATSARQTLSRTARNASARSAEFGASVRDRTRLAMGTTRRQAERARRGFDYLLQEQPLALGAIGLAVGAVIAAAAPRTRTEDEWMGEASARFTADLKQTGKEQVEKAGEAASAAISAETQREPATPPARQTQSPATR
jgi:hypothetical protein